MNGVIDSLMRLFSTYGFKAGCIIVGVVLLVNLIKKPITKKAAALSSKFGYDKSVVTRYISLLPVGVSLFLTAVVELVSYKFHFTAVDWQKVLANALLYAAIAVAVYETIKKQLQAYAAKANYKNLNPQEEPAGKSDEMPPEIEEAEEHIILEEENENVEVL